jgi:hypothetical protein
MVWVVFSSWFGNRAGGCDQAREGNTDRSMHWHCIVPDPLPDHGVQALSRYLARTNAQEASR